MGQDLDKLRQGQSLVLAFTIERSTHGVVTAMSIRKAFAGQILSGRIEQILSTLRERGQIYRIGRALYKARRG